MRSKELGRSDPWSERNFVLVLDDGEEAFASIKRFCEENNITGASLTAIGAFRQPISAFSISVEKVTSTFQLRHSRKF